MAEIEFPKEYMEALERVRSMSEEEKQVRLAELDRERKKIWELMKEHGGIVHYPAGHPKIREWWALTARKYPLDLERNMIINPGLYFGPVETDLGILLESGITPKDVR